MGRAYSISIVGSSAYTTWNILPCALSERSKDHANGSCATGGENHGADLRMGGAVSGSFGDSVPLVLVAAAEHRAKYDLRTTGTVQWHFELTELATFGAALDAFWCLFRFWWIMRCHADCCGAVG